MDTFSPSSDITEQLLHRYGKSAAAQHRHLCATAAATRSIIQSESLPLTPLSYFAVSISTLSDHNDLDSDALGALSAFLSIVIPLVPKTSISPDKAKEAVEVVVQRISNCNGEGSMGNASARALIKCLGLLIGFCDLEIWDSIDYGFRTLLGFAIDKRPKVRKCAQDCVLTVFKSFKSTAVIKKSSKLVYSLLKDRMALAVELSSLNAVDGYKEVVISTQHQEVLHLMNVLKMVVPYLSDKFCDQLLVHLLKVLSPKFSPLTNHVLDTVEVVLETSRTENTISNIENIITCLVPYINLKGKNTVDTVLSAASLAKRTIGIAHMSDVSGWITYLPSVIGPIASLLNSETAVALQASKMLKELIKQNIDHKLLTSIKDHMEADKEISDTELIAIEGVCAKFDDLITTGTALNEHFSAVISVLFLRLGEVSNIFMKSILLKLAEAMNVSSVTASDEENLRKCVGSAVVAMGPEKLLALLQISPSMKDFARSNAWLLPVFKEYVIGSSLGFFMERFLPLDESYMGSHKGLGQDLQTSCDNCWELLPAFCRYPTDISKSFRALANVLISCTKDSSRIEIVAIGLQRIVNQNKSILSSDEGCKSWLTMLKFEDEDDFMQELRRKHSYSKKTAAKNLKTLASCSEDLLQAFVDAIFDLYPERHGYLKDAIGCLASITEPSIVEKIFNSSLKKLVVINESGEYEGLQFHDRGSDENTEAKGSSRGKDKKRGLLLELAASFVEGASEDVIKKLYIVIKHLLKDSSEFGQPEAYYTMSQMLEKHPSFCSSRFSEVVDLLLKLNSPSEIMPLKGRFACFNSLLIHAVKETLDEQDDKAFLILNEIILALKDSKEEGRKAAYDALIQMVSTLQNSSCDGTSTGPYHKLIAMVLGYLSGSSPHMKSGAISALSVLVYNDVNIFCSVPEVVPSVLALLQSKAAEVVKAVLGFVKVMVSSLQAEELQSFLPEIVNGILRWSSISRNHFRAKVTIILEIMIRKCGKSAIESLTPKKYEGYLRSVFENRHGKSNSKNLGSGNTESRDSNISSKSFYSKTKMEQNDNSVSTKDEDSVGFRKRKREYKSHNHNVKEQHLSSSNHDSPKPMNQQSYHDKWKAKESPLPGRDRRRKFGQAQPGAKVKRMRTEATPVDKPDVNRAKVKRTRMRTEATPVDKPDLNKPSAKPSKFKRVGKPHSRNK